MRKILVIGILVIASFSFAQEPVPTRPFAGGGAQALYIPGTRTVLIGGSIQVGAYNLAGPLGIRATGEVFLMPFTAFQLETDLLFSFGSETFVPYIGIGGGAMFDPTSPLAIPNVHSVVGVEVVTVPELGVYVEAVPTLLLVPIIGVQAFVIRGRAGLNFHF